VLVGAACSGSDDPVDLKDAVKVDKGDIGQCLLFDEAIGDTVQKLPYIDCTEAHTHEIYAVLTYEPDVVYPGFGDLEDEARTYCLEQFEDYVGRSAFDSSLFYSWMVPTLDGWNDKDVEDRSTVCVLGAPGSTLSETMKGKNR